jgi:Na+-transporting methylmalonyl-CoA/oxaloacetate decarboxylase gamma subunit
MIDALWITLIGMGITFAAIILLWWMMAGLTALPIKDEDESEAADDAVEAVGESQGLQAKAAAIAVAIALAEQELSSARPLPPPPTAIVSAWQLSTRTRQLSEKGKQRRR